VALEQQWLEPGVEILDGPIALRAPLRDEDRRDGQIQTQADHAGQVTRRFAPADELAGVVELDLSRHAERVPSI